MKHTVVNKPFFHIIGTYWFIKYKDSLKGIQIFRLCIPTDIELSYRLLLSLHSIIAVSVYPSIINSCISCYFIRVYQFFKVSQFHSASAALIALKCCPKYNRSTVYKGYQKVIKPARQQLHCLDFRQNNTVVASRTFKPKIHGSSVQWFNCTLFFYNANLLQKLFLST